MKILRIEADNFKPFKQITIPEDPDMEIPEGLILIRGPNSTGKSSLFEAILWCLWGPDAILPTNDDLINFSSTFCKVSVVFEIEGTKYKVERTYDRADGMKVFMFYKTDEGWHRLAHKANEVKSKMKEILNLDYKQALETVLVRQGEVSKIADARPAELRKLLGDVYNLEIIRNMTAQLSYLESDLSARIERLQNQYESPDSINQNIEGLKEEIKERKADLKQIKNEMTGLKKRLKTLPKLDEIRELEEAIELMERLRYDLEKAKEDRDTYLAEAGVAVASEEVIERKLASLSKRKEKIERENEEIRQKIRDIDQEIGGIKGQRKDLETKIRNLQNINISDDEGKAECPTCSKPLTIEERDAIIEDYKGIIIGGREREKQLIKKRDDYRKKMIQNDKEIKIIEGAIQALGRIASRQASVDKIAKELQSAKDRLDRVLGSLKAKSREDLLAKYQVQSIREIEKEIASINATLSTQSQRLQDIQEEIDSRRAKIDELEKRIAKMIALKAEKDELTKLLKHTNYLRLKLVSGFIADYVVQKRLIGIIRGATNEYVKAFTNGQYSSIDLIAKGSGKSMGLVLQVRDKRDSATKRSSQLSFGDRTAISLALRLGISRTMSSIRPLKDSPAVSPKVRCVLLDEPLAGLDRDRRKSVVQNLMNDVAFRQIYLITHTDVQDWQGVSVIDIHKSGNFSTVTLRTNGPE